MRKIRIRFSFLLFNAILFMLRSTPLILGFYGACVLHELGHVAAVRLTGGEILRVELSCFGIRITASPPRTLKGGAFVLLSGPAVNLVTGGIPLFFGIRGYFTMFSLWEGALNLLPFSFLDGGALLDLLISGTEREERLRPFVAVLRGLTAVGILFGALFFIPAVN